MKTLAPHQQRVADELAQLEQRISDLCRFIASSSIFPSLPAAEQSRLRRQLMAMTLYAGILSDRIEAFTA